MGNFMTNLSLASEEATAHLTLLGWWPVRVTLWLGASRKEVGVRSARQVATYRWGRAQFRPIDDSMKFEDIDWWVLTDETIDRLVKAIDNSLVGW